MASLYGNSSHKHPLVALMPDNKPISTKNAILTLFIASIAVLVSSFFKIKSYRESVIKRSGALKKVTWNKWFGTIPAMVELFKESPAKAHPQGHMTLLYRKFKLDNVWFLDSWPANSEPQIVIADPVVAAQVTQAKSLPKHALLKQFTGHVAGELSILYSEGALWKKTRAMFNPGFAVSHLMTLVPSIVDDAMVFHKNLEKAADDGGITSIEHLAAMFAFDVMGHVVLDHDLNSQLGSNELVDSFRKVVQWTPQATNVNPFSNLNPTRRFMYWYYGKKMKDYIGNILEERYATRSELDSVSVKGKRKPGIDLALDEYARQEAEEGKKAVKGLDPSFKALAIDSMRSFLFAGHDSTSTTISFIYHSLSKHPEAAAKVRKELDEVFGSDLATTADRLKENPSLINKLVYLGAVIKETLRLYPPASTVRKGDPSVQITYDGVTYPTAGCLIWVVSHTIHRRADLFPSPDSFIPERFLPADDPDQFQEVPKDAWRPFEKGPRNCIGQELATLEIKIVIALTIRDFDVCNAYEANDRRLGRPNPGGMEGGTRGMFGERAYQELQASAKPHDAFPGFVTRRSPVTEI